MNGVNYNVFYNEKMAESTINGSKRKDFMMVEDDAHNSHPNRFLYSRKNTDINEIINTCSKKLQVNSLHIFSIITLNHV
jgi:hypothetical protein